MTLKRTLPFSEDDIQDIFEYLLDANITTEKIESEINSAGGISDYARKIYEHLSRSAEWDKFLDLGNTLKLHLKEKLGVLVAEIRIHCTKNSQYEDFVKDFNARHNPLVYNL